MGNYQNIQFEKHGNYAQIVIDRPKALNALNQSTLREIGSALEEVESLGVRLLIITGAGDKAFVAGADLVAMQGMDPAEAETFSLMGHRILQYIEALNVPVIAAVNGFALGGGCELAMACDIVFASEDARFGQPEVGLGLIPGFGGTLRLARYVGLQRAKELLYSGRRIKAREAAKIGLVARVYPHDELLPACYQFAETLSKKGPKAVAEVKSILHLAPDLPFSKQVALESRRFGSLFGTKEQQEGVAAFLDRRQPDFTS